MNIICTKCKIELDQSNFYIRKTGKHQSWCKDCMRKLHTKEKSQTYRDNNRDHFNQLKRDSRKRNWLSVKLREIKARAKRFGLDYNLTRDSIIVPEYCPILNIKLDSNSENSDEWPSIDRICNDRGYLVDNIVITSNKANLLKRDASLEELWLLHSKYQEIIENKQPWVEI